MICSRSRLSNAHSELPAVPTASSILFRSGSPLTLLVGSLFFGLVPQAHAEDLPAMDPLCDTVNNTTGEATPDGLVDGAPDVWLSGADPDAAGLYEDQQYLNLLNFYSLILAPSALRSPAPFPPIRIAPSLELAYVPSLNCLERAVFYGTKTEYTNKTPVLPRIRVSVSLPLGFHVGISGVPPVTLFGVTSLVLGGDLGWGTLIDDKLELGARAFLTTARIEGEMAGPPAGSTIVPKTDVFRTRMMGIEALVGYRLTMTKNRLVPYAGLGYTDVFAWMYVGENYANGYDDANANEADAPSGAQDGDFSGLYKGPHFQLGIQGRAYDLLDGAFELYMVPLNLLTPSDRFFVSPRIRIGIAF